MRPEKQPPLLSLCCSAFHLFDDGAHTWASKAGADETPTCCIGLCASQLRFTSCLQKLQRKVCCIRIALHRDVTQLKVICMYILRKETQSVVNLSIPIGRASSLLCPLLWQPEAGSAARGRTEGEIAWRRRRMGDPDGAVTVGAAASSFGRRTRADRELLFTPRPGEVVRS
jgi:hypothetical protein